PLRLLRQPAADIAEADDVVAVIAHQRRQQPVGNAELALLGEDEEAVVADRCIKRRPLFLPVGDELVQRDRVDHRAREDVGADLRAFLDETDATPAPGFGGELLQPDRRREAGRTAADDDDVVFHHIALHVSSLPCLRHWPPTPRPPRRTSRLYTGSRELRT